MASDCRRATSSPNRERPSATARGGRQRRDKLSGVTVPNVARAWRRFLIDLDLAKHYPAATIHFPPTVQRRNPILDRLLPSLLHVKAVAVLDAALKHVLHERGWKVPRKGYTQGLHG